MSCRKNKMNENEIDKELKEFSLQLKAICDKNGIEKYFNKSAEIIHKLGMVYFRQSLNKVSLIQSVGLLNSAILRKPKNILKVKQDLSNVCLHVLQQAKAQDSTADLMEKAIEIKQEIKAMRERITNKLKFMKIIQDWEKQCSAKVKYQQKKNRNYKRYSTAHYQKLQADNDKHMSVLSKCYGFSTLSFCCGWNGFSCKKRNHSVL